MKQFSSVKPSWSNWGN